MFTTLAAAVILSCAKPAQYQPPRVTTACEGADQVTRNHDGLEVSRAVNGCSIVRCEGADRVRRSFEGFQLSRAVNACTIARCEGWDFVLRTTDGQTLSRVAEARRCVPPTYVTPVVVSPPQPQNDGLRYGLSYR